MQLLCVCLSSWSRRLASGGSFACRKSLLTDEESMGGGRWTSDVSSRSDPRQTLLLLPLLLVFECTLLVLVSSCHFVPKRPLTLLMGCFYLLPVMFATQFCITLFFCESVRRAAKRCPMCEVSAALQLSGRATLASGIPEQTIMEKRAVGLMERLQAGI